MDDVDELVIVVGIATGSLIANGSSEAAIFGDGAGVLWCIKISSVFCGAIKISGMIIKVKVQNPNKNILLLFAVFVT